MKGWLHCIMLFIFARFYRNQKKLYEEFTLQSWTDGWTKELTEQISNTHFVDQFWATVYMYIQ